MGLGISFMILLWFWYDFVYDFVMILLWFWYGGPQVVSPCLGHLKKFDAWGLGLRVQALTFGLGPRTRLGEYTFPSGH